MCSRRTCPANDKHSAWHVNEILFPYFNFPLAGSVSRRFQLAGEFTAVQSADGTSKKLAQHAVGAEEDV
jgi:hypothetical protein